MDRSTRKFIYNQLLPTTQDLLIKLYGSRKVFLDTPSISPLEPTILAFDELMGDARRVRDLAARIGISIPPGQDPDVYFYNSLEQLIDIISTYTNTTQLPPHYQPLISGNPLDPNTLPRLQNLFNLDNKTYSQMQHQWTSPLLNTQRDYDNRLDTLMRLSTLAQTQDKYYLL